ncbi:transmembrane protein 140 [Dendropsophus ebraccatus]|uniref:transmembrane protein 140 n=1 Tax=Dendropsophus ebraccatus TaxID=150705 RepID=UPI003831378F
MSPALGEFSQTSPQLSSGCVHTLRFIAAVTDYKAGNRSYTEVSSPVTLETSCGAERHLIHSEFGPSQKDRMVGCRKTCLSLPCLGYTIILVQSLICLLLVYALILGGGNILVNGCKTIGFYSYCFYNTTAGDDCHCFTRFEDLHVTGIAIPHGFTVSLILTYSSLVIVVMGLTTLALAQWLKDEAVWRYQLGLNIFSLVGLLLGTATHLILTWDQFDLSHVTPNFLALLVAISGLSLQSCLISWYIRLNNVMSSSKSGGHASEDLSFLVA